MSPANQYVDIRNGAYYVAGTRIGLDVIASEFWAGRSPESIFEAYPAIGSLGKVYGAVTFLLENADAVASYLQEQAQRYQAIQSENPLPEEMTSRYDRVKANAPARDV